MVEDNIISFIFCVNNELLLRNAKEFISELIVPENITIEIIEIRNAKSITSGYNEGMRKAKGKIKVYLHQDLYIVNPFFICDILRVFEDSTVGLIGVAGSKQIPRNFIWWEAEANALKGSTYEMRNYHMTKLEFQKAEKLFEEVQVLDGLLLITQYDIPWRDDILDGWHFYDISQSLEFLKKGLKVVVPYMEKPWTIHDCGIPSMDKYDWYRNIMIKEYT